MALLQSGERGAAAETVEACASVPDVRAGLTAHTIALGGRARGYKVYVPEAYDGLRPVPLVFDLHASGIAPATELEITRLDAAADRHGFVVVLPEAATPFASGGMTWNLPRRAGGPDDVAFVLAVLDAVRSRLCVDPHRVFAVGFSGGGRLASALACAAPGRFAAIGVVGGLRDPARSGRRCPANARAVSVLAMHSVDDPINTFRHVPGRNPAYWTHGVQDALTGWAHRLGCRGEPVETVVAADVVRRVFTGCRDGARLIFYRLSGTGHTWPGSPFTFPPSLGGTEHRVDATAAILGFFGLAADGATESRPKPERTPP